MNKGTIAIPCNGIIFNNNEKNEVCDLEQDIWLLNILYSVKEPNSKAWVLSDYIYVSVWWKSWLLSRATHERIASWEDLQAKPSRREQ